MKRLLMLALLTLTTASAALWAIPATINYQGSLKEKGLPVTATKQMLFRITDASGQQVYWSSLAIPVTVTNGLFAVPLTPTGVNWETTTPYIEVSVEGQMLLPREPINSTVYATVSNSVVDGAVTPNKVASGYGLVPAGMIALFDTACPAGWTPFSALDNRFPMGGSSSGARGGATTHSHTVNPHSHTVPDHSHNIDDSSLHVGIGIRNLNYDNNLVMQLGGIVGAFSAVNASPWYGYGNGMSHPAPTGSNPLNVGVSGPKISGGTTSSGNTLTGNSSPGTDAQNQLPPYLSVLFCKKL